ncbi:MAG: dihydropyrimidinase [Candidatus Hodarchaeales archaeon]
MDLAIENGTLVFPDRLQKANIGIEQGKIVVISLNSIKNGENYIDANKKLVFPGIIDSHLHFELLEKGEPVTVDDFAKGSEASIYGGVTSLIDFANQYEGEKPLESVKNRLEIAEKKSLLNFGLHLTVTYPNPEYLQEYQKVVEFGISSFKIFMINIGEGYLSDADIFSMLKAIGKARGMAMIHAENGSVQKLLVEEALERGENKVMNYATTKPDWSEAEAIERVTRLGHNANCPIFIVHLSTEKGLKIIKQRINNGYHIITESCPHYLNLTEEKYLENNGALYVMGPPLRKTQDKENLWDGLKDKTISIVSSDHCAFTKDQKLSSPYFNRIPYGFMGTEILFPVTFSEGIKRGMSPQDIARILSSNPAKIYGMAPEKGSIAVGSDADLSILDPKKEIRITHDMMHTNAGYTGYEGFEVKGWPEITISGGNILMKDNELFAKPGDGKFIKRKSFKNNFRTYYS